MAKFFRFPFGTSGDRTAIPDAVDPSGAVSYAQGFGPDYELELGVDPGAKPVPREGTNQLNFDITDNLRQYQIYGAPEWFPASENGGVAISYPLNAIVRRADLVYRSIVANNTVEPGTDPAQWALDGVAGNASTTTPGLVQYATSPETIARAATDRAVTPAGLGALIAALMNAPIFPDVLGTTGLFTLTNPAGNVRLAAGTQWVHRGVEKYTSVQTDLPTVASKTYHLRWTPTGGFALMDLSSGAYNPSAVAETDPVFDTTLDDMLVARVVTSAGNAATITPLANKHQLAAEGETGQGAAPFTVASDFSATVTYDLPLLNWGRRPRIQSIHPIVGVTSSTEGGLDGFANRLNALVLNRYRPTVTVASDFAGPASGYYALTRWNFAL